VRQLENISLLATSIVGLAAFSLPFFISTLTTPTSIPAARSLEATILLSALLAGSTLIAIAENARGSGMTSSSRSVALLGILVAIDATLRLAPSFYGASPIFALIVLVGYVFGARFGFVMGSLTLFLSAAITAGVGPWLPFQMLCAGWVGLGAGLLPHSNSPSAHLGVIVAFGTIAGFAFGALMNLYSWPLAAPGTTTDAGLYWSPRLTLKESIEHYAAFYVATSLVHDLTRAVANATLILVAGAPVIRILERFRIRTSWSGPEVTVT
jgi:energy-coupling factor transport system substrate-specific component